MFISDQVFTEIFKAYGYDEIESDHALENIRSEQLALFFLTFFTYYEQAKTPVELQYLQKIVGRLSEPKDLQKLADVVYTEITFNPELQAQIRRKLEDYSLEIIFNLLFGLEETKQNQILDVLYAQGYQAQQLQTSGNL